MAGWICAMSPAVFPLFRANGVFMMGITSNEGELAELLHPFESNRNNLSTMRVSAEHKKGIRETVPGCLADERRDA